jgi:hypothetical protein
MPQSPARLPKIRRADPEQLAPFELGESHKRMLRLLHRYRYLTAPLLALGYSQERGRGRSHVENELGKLYHREYVHRFYYSTRPTGYGSDAFVYTLARRGAHSILDAGEYTATRHAIENRAKPKRNYQHHLAIATLQLILDLGADPWTVEAFHSDDVEETKFTATVDRRHRTYYPDALAVLRYPNGKRSGYFFEVDLAHKAEARLDGRFTAYAEYLTAHRRDLKTAHGIAGAVVVFVVPTEQQLDRALERAHKSLASWGRKERPVFLFWNLESWYTTTEKGRALKDPQRILAAESVATIAGNPRRLVNA